MRSIRSFAKDHPIIAEVGLILIFLLLRMLVPMLSFLLPGSPLQISRLPHNGHIPEEQLRMLMLYFDHVVGTIPYLLAGFVAAEAMGTVWVVVSGVILLVISHVVYPIAMAPFVYDYARLSAYGLGISLGLGVPALAKKPARAA